MNYFGIPLNAFYSSGYSLQGQDTSCREQEARSLWRLERR